MYKWEIEDEVTPEMKQFEKAVIEICIAEQRMCSVVEIAERMKIDTFSASRLREDCVDAGLIDEYEWDLAEIKNNFKSLRPRSMSVMRQYIPKPTPIIET